MRDYLAVATAYARRAVADVTQEDHCKWVVLACQRYLDDIRRAEAGPEWGFYLDPWHANDICDFLEKLPHIEGIWGPDNLIVLEPAQVFWLVNLFGWRRHTDGTRRFRVTYLEMGRKNAKSTLAAGISLYCLLCEGENGPQVVIGATTGAQALKVFRPAKAMVDKTPDLRAAYDVAAFARSIACYSNNGNIETINAKAKTQDGWNPHLAVLDELHAHPDRDLFDVIRSAFGSRQNPLLLVITTAGHNSSGVCYQQRTLLTKILEGVTEADHFFGIIYTLDEGDDPFDKAVWIKANPLLGVSVKIDELSGYAIEAKDSAEAAYEFKTKRANIWVTARGAHIDIAKWKLCNRPVDLARLKDVPCWGGLDLASTTDMCALRFIWKLDGLVYTWGRAYLPEAAVRPRSEKANVPYLVWAEKGLLTVTEGDVTDYSVIEADIKWACDTLNVTSISYDPWGARDLVNLCMADNVPLVEFRQGLPSFNAPMKELDRLYRKGLLAHGGDEILSWQASNVVARSDANDNIAPSKEKSQEKIDGYVALLMAIGECMVSAPPPKSIYEDEAAYQEAFG